ncbi:MAG: hypothetical protein ACR652_17765 [Methylocystis sp.]|uniref:hypothetical protein n=1 Tax=Methylocystis sp. TaxID=1911079 RepID=UPI003DA483B1
MAVEADKVVVSLIADNAQFDAANKASAQQFQQIMRAIQSAGKGAEAGVAQFSSALKENRLEFNQSRVAMMEWQHIGRGFADQLAAGAPLTQAFAQHIGMIGQAMSLSAQNAGETQSVFAKFAGFLGTGWGIAATFALVGIIKLIQAHKSEGDALEEALDKLKKHAEATRTSEEADRIWANTLDGLIDRQKKLNDELGKRLQTQSAVDRQELSGAEADRDRLQNELNTAEQQLAKAKEQLEAAKAAAPNIKGGQIAVQSATGAVEAAQKEVTRITQALDEAQGRVARSMAILGEAQGDLTSKANDFGQQMKNNVAALISADPALASFARSLYGAGDALGKSMQEAASANVNFDDVAHKVDDLYKRLSEGKISVSAYTAELKKMAAALHDSAEAAKKLAAQDPVKTFKAAVIGAEGTGPNRLGSSAAGFGQFMPGTWLSYFNQLFPDKAALSDASKLAYRNVRSVAEAVIDKATDDYVKVIQKAGQGVTAANLYAVHVLGSRDAAKFFAAAPGAQTSSFLSAAVLKGNPFLQGTKAEAAAALAKRIGDSSGAVSGAAAAMQELANKQLQSDADFLKKSLDLDAKIIAAKDDQVHDELARADIAEDRVRAEQATMDAAIDADAQAKKLAGLDAKTVDTQAATLKEKNAQLASEKIATIELQKQAEIAKRAHDAADQRYEFELADLKGTEQLATSQAQRRQIELELLDLKYQQKVEDLEYLKMTQERNKDFAAARLTQQQIDHLPYEKGAEAVGIEMSTMGPWQDFLRQIPKDARAANEAVQGFAVDGVRSLVDGLGQASVAWIKMGGLAGQVIKTLISKIITLILYQQIARLFGSSMLPNLGVDAPLGGFGTAPSISLPDLPTFAGGGAGIIGGFGGVDNNMLSLNGQPVAWVSRGEKLSISPSNDRAATGYGAAQGLVLVQIAASPYFDGRVLQVAGPVIAQAATGATQGGATLARDNLARKSLHRLDY